MALVTQADVDLILGYREQYVNCRGKLNEITTLLSNVYEHIRMDDPLNDGVDFANIVAAYQSDYDAALGELKALALALPRWGLV